MAKTKKNAGGEAKAKAPKTPKEAKPVRESTRANWRGFSMCEVTRWGGSKKFSHDKICAILDKMKLPHAAVYLERRHGLAGENLPAFSKEDRIEFNKIAEKIPDDIKGWSRTSPGPAAGSKPRAAKATPKAGKSPSKAGKAAAKGGKKAAKAVDPEDALESAAAAGAAAGMAEDEDGE